MVNLLRKRFHVKIINKERILNKIEAKKNPLLRVGKIAMKKKVMLNITNVKVILIIK